MSLNSINQPPELAGIGSRALAFGAATATVAGGVLTITAVATPRMDELLSPSRDADGVVSLHAFSRGEGGRIMSLEPRVNPNEVAIELFREMSAAVRRIDDKLDMARDELAEVRGAEIPASLRAQGEVLQQHHTRLNQLEEARRTADAVSRPWWWAFRKAAESVITALVGAIGALLVIKGGHP